MQLSIVEIVLYAILTGFIAVLIDMALEAIKPPKIVIGYAYNLKQLNDNINKIKQGS